MIIIITTTTTTTTTTCFHLLPDHLPTNVRVTLLLVLFLNINSSRLSGVKTNVFVFPLQATIGGQN